MEMFEVNCSLVGVVQNIRPAMQHLGVGSGEPYNVANVRIRRNNGSTVKEKLDTFGWRTAVGGTTFACFSDVFGCWLLLTIGEMFTKMSFWRLPACYYLY